MSSDIEKRLRAEKATEWLLRLQDASPSERAGFLKWVKESPLNVREVLLSNDTQKIFAHLVRDYGIDVFAGVENSGEGKRIDPEESRAIAMEVAKTESVAARRSAWKAAAAVACLAVLGLVSFIGVEVRADLAIDTGPGEKQTIRLSDGTAVHAGSRTRVSVAYSSRQRLVRLERGEALFEVEKDPTRPFLVETHFSTVRAVGTAFVVNRVDPEVDVVTVKEGVVAVSRAADRTSDDEVGTHATFRAGEEVRVTKAASLTVARVPVRKALASIDGRLEFDRETVAEAIRQFNLRNETQIRVSTKEIGQRPIRGVFDARDPAEFAAFLERHHLVAVIDDVPGVLVLVPDGPARAADDK